MSMCEQKECKLYFFTEKHPEIVENILKKYDRINNLETKLKNVSNTAEKLITEIRWKKNYRELESLVENLENALIEAKELLEEEEE